MSKEYGVHFTSNDGTETHIGGHYPTLEKADESAKKHKANGNLDVYIVVREVTEWRKVDGKDNSGDWETRGIYGYAENWLSQNGYEWKLTKERRRGNTYLISRDGIDEEIEITPNVTNFKKYMELIQLQFDLARRVKAKA